jgi:hypothetical protein
MKRVLIAVSYATLGLLACYALTRRNRPGGEPEPEPEVKLKLKLKPEPRLKESDARPHLAPVAKVLGELTRTVPRQARDEGETRCQPPRTPDQTVTPSLWRGKLDEPLPIRDSTADFPDTGPHRPERFESLVRSVISQCAPQIDLRLLDCTEYPCIVYGARTGDLPESAVVDCPQWRTAFPDGTWFTADSFEVDGKQEGFVVFFPRPAEDRRSRALRRRIEDRLMGICDAYRQSWCDDIFVLLN